jgi:enamine deaminase RidA (YjgF/YER057c/UK114 family)
MPRAAASQRKNAKAQSASAEKAMGTENMEKIKKPRMLPPPPVRMGIEGSNAQSVVVANQIIYLAGQMAKDFSKDFEGQAQQVFQQIEKLLEQSMSDKTKIIRTDIFLKDPKDYPKL